MRVNIGSVVDLTSRQVYVEQNVMLCWTTTLLLLGMGFLVFFLLQKYDFLNCFFAIIRLFRRLYLQIVTFRRIFCL
jgi:hypothetical protein